jgi:hypothetical protein
MTAIKEETPRSIPPPILPRTLPTKVIIYVLNLKNYFVFIRHQNQLIKDVLHQNYLK